MAGNLASGGLLGLVGSLLTGIVSIFQARSQFQHDEQMAEINLKLIAANSVAAAQVSADQLRNTVEQMAGQAFTASQVAGTAAANTPPFIAGLLSLWRPALTAGLIGFAVYVYPTASEDMKAYIVRTYIEVGGAAVLWWFGSRQMEKAFPSKPRLSSAT